MALPKDKIETKDIESYGSIDKNTKDTSLCLSFFPHYLFSSVQFDINDFPVPRSRNYTSGSEPSSPESERHWRGSIRDLEMSGPNHAILWLMVVGYVLVGVVYYSLTTSWGVIDSVYFTVQTVTTVGYGDFVPFAPSHMVFTSVYILVGVGFIGSCLGVLVGSILDQEEEIILSRLALHNTTARLSASGYLGGIPGHGSSRYTHTGDLDWSNYKYEKQISYGDEDTSDSNKEEEESGTIDGHLDIDTNIRTKKRKASFTATVEDRQFQRLRSHLLFSLVNLFLVIAVGTVSFSYLEKKPWYEALYFSVVSVTTVGYGDEVCSGPISKCFAVVYLVVGCLFVAAALADIAAFPIESRRQSNELKVLRQYGDEVSKGDLKDITHTAHQLFAEENDEMSCTKEQFALVMLLKMQKIRPDDIRACMNQFEKLDHDHNGTIDATDVAISRVMRKTRHASSRAASKSIG